MSLAERLARGEIDPEEFRRQGLGARTIAVVSSDEKAGVVGAEPWVELPLKGEVWLALGGEITWEQRGFEPTDVDGRRVPPLLVEPGRPAAPPPPVPLESAGPGPVRSGVGSSCRPAWPPC